MMSGDNFTDGFGKTRPALADVTNRKRGSSLVSGDIGLKDGDGYGKNVDGEDGNLLVTKKVCLGVEKLFKDKCETKFGVVDGREKDLSPSCSEVGTSHENSASAVVNLPNKSRDTLKFFDGSVQVAKDDRIQESSVEVGYASRDSCVSSVSMPVCSEPCKKNCCGVGGKCRDEEVRLTSGVMQSNAVSKGLVTRVCKDNEKDLGLGNLTSSNYGSIDLSRLRKSQGSKFHELERCTGLKDDGCANLNAGDDVLKSCSCSFCLTAGYIWSDLNYQDIKGRIAVLKKSQKEASNLVQRVKETDTHDQGNCSISSKLASDLTSQWKSLFLHMGDIFVHESNQLQASFVTLKDLRKNCKTDLGMTNGMASDKH